VISIFGISVLILDKSTINIYIQAWQSAQNSAVTDFMTISESDQATMLNTINFMINSILCAYFFIVQLCRADGALTSDITKIAGSWMTGLKRLLPVIAYVIALTLAYGIVVYGIFLLSKLTNMVGPWASFALYVGAFILGVYVTIRLFYGYMLLASRQHGILSAIKTSWHLSKNYIWKIIFALILVISIPNIAFSLLRMGLVNIIPTISHAEFTMSIILTLLQNFVMLTLVMGMGYVFLNDSIHRKANK